MENRLKIYGFLNEKEDAEMALEDLVEKLKVADGYMLSISILNKETIEHSLVTNNFRKIDMIPAHKLIKDLIIKELESENELSFLND